VASLGRKPKLFASLILFSQLWYKPLLVTRAQNPTSYLAFASRSRRPKSMSQILRQGANTLSKVSIFGVLSVVGGLVLFAIVLARSTYVTRAHEFVKQALAPQAQDFLKFDHGDQSVHDLVDAEAHERSPLV
jgi:hypothetical protein